MHHYQLHLRPLSLSHKCPFGISHRVLYSSEPLKLTGRDSCSTILGGLDIWVESDEQPWHVSKVVRACFHTRGGLTFVQDVINFLKGACGQNGVALIPDQVWNCLAHRYNLASEGVPGTHLIKIS